MSRGSKTSSVHVDAEIAAGRVSEAGYRQLVHAEVCGQASTMQWLEARLLALRSALRAGQVVQLAGPGAAVTLATDDQLYAWCNEELPGAYECFFRVDGGPFPHLRLAAPAARSWREAYPGDAAYLRREALADPFAHRETASDPESPEIGIRFDHGVHAAVAGGDLELATAFFTHSMQLGERVRAGPRTGHPESADITFFRPIHLARNARIECLSRLFVSGSWDRETFATGLAEATAWCFGPAAQRRWEGTAVVPAVLATLRMALIGGDRDVFERLWKRFDRVAPVHEMLLWRDVTRESAAARQSALVRDYVAACPKGDNGSIEGNETYQLELAMIALVLAGTAPRRVELPALVEEVLGGPAASGAGR